MTESPLNEPFDLEIIMRDLRNSALDGDELAVRSMQTIALLLCGYRQGDVYPSAKPTLYQPPNERAN